MSILAADSAGVATGATELLFRFFTAATLEADTI
jgi:hypothetical protein